MRDHHVVLLISSRRLSRATLALASQLAARRNAVLLLLYVLGAEDTGSESMLHAAVDLLGGEDERWLARLHPTDAGVRCRRTLTLGDPLTALQRLAETRVLDLVVAEDPPRSWISRALSRSGAERLIPGLPCPLLIAGPRVLDEAVAPRPPARAAPPHPAETADLLDALVETRALALRRWMGGCAEAAEQAAASLTVQALAGARSDAGRLERRLAVELDETRRATRALGWQLRLGERRWESEPFELLPCRALARLFTRVQEHGRSCSLPMALDERLERVVLVAAARVPGVEGHLLLIFDAEDEFLRVLGQPGPLDTLETYAFDDTGLMLSHSRFPEHLLQAGLLPSAGAQTPLRLRVAEPSPGPVEAWPLTRMAREATQRRDGVDLRGYRDYRGAEVVGAWRWVEEYGFGVAAEVDHAPRAAL